jgi:hypothetical protein
MGETVGKLSVFYDEPFWVGVFERIEDGKLSVAKVTFGAEPKDYEVYDFVLKHYYNLQFSPAVEVAVAEKHINPKRMQREIKKQMSNTGIGTKSQQALKLQHEQYKTERKKKNREQKQAEEQRLFELRQQKKKENHRGR